MVVTTGFFDGVHLGHRFILRQLVEAAHERGEESMVISFWPHPRTVFQDDAISLRLLTSVEEKKKMILDLGVDRVEILPFTKSFSHLTAEEYLRDYVIGRYGGTAVLLGYDNRFGSDSSATGDIRSLAASMGLDVIVAENLEYEGKTVSSTKVRAALASGNVEEASAMLGYGYSLFGVVVSGNRLGRTMGFPTANMQLFEPLKQVPANGVYLVKVRVGDENGEQYYGMCNIGVRPTVAKGNATTIETHIFGFNEDIYGLPIRIEFCSKIRDERKFSGLDELRVQLNADKNFCLSMIK